MIYIGNQKVAPHIGNKKINKVYIGANRIYSSLVSHLVTYKVDNSITHTEKVGEGKTCLSPSSFVPDKSGYNFVGWREDDTASGEVLTEKLMGNKPITLYAVFKKSITATYYNGSTSATKTVKDLYYNNENVTNPTFNLSQATKSGWSQRGWATSTAGNASVVYNNNANFQISADVTLYGLYSQTVKLSYNGNGSTGGNTSDQTGTRYYNSSGNYTNPSFSLKSNSFSRTYYKFVNWAMGSTGGTRYNPGASVTLTQTTVFYAMWTANTTSKTITKNVVTAINNWEWVRTLVPYDGVVFASPPSLTMSGEKKSAIVTSQKTYAIIRADSGASGGSWNVTATVSGQAYESAAASGLTCVRGEFPIQINNWSGGSRNISFGRTFKKPPRMDWYSPNPSPGALQGVNWTITFTNVTTTGCTVSWSKSTGGETRDFGWIAEGEI